MHQEVLTAISQEAGGLRIFPSEQCGSVGAEHFVVPWRNYAQDIKHSYRVAPSFIPPSSLLSNPISYKQGLFDTGHSGGGSLSQNLLNPQGSSKL